MDINLDYVIESLRLLQLRDTIQVIIIKGVYIRKLPINIFLHKPITSFFYFFFLRNMNVDESVSQPTRETPSGILPFFFFAQGQVFYFPEA